MSALGSARFLKPCEGQAESIEVIREWILVMPHRTEPEGDGKITSLMDACDLVFYAKKDW